MRIALVGAGGMGTCHYMNYRHIEGAQVVALVGRGEREFAAHGIVQLERAVLQRLERDHGRAEYLAERGHVVAGVRINRRVAGQRSLAHERFGQHFVLYADCTCGAGEAAFFPALS